MKKLNFSWLQKFFNSTIAFGSKNAPTIMTGGSIVLGWAAVYVFWKQSKKAEEEIVATEEKLFVKREEGEDVEAVLPAKEKAIIYLKHCWPAALMGLGSTAGTVWAHKMDLSRLAEMYMLTQFLEGKNSDQEKLIEKLKGEVSKKKFNQLEDEIMKEKFPPETIGNGTIEDTGKGPTLFISDVGGIKFRSSITAVQHGIIDFREMLCNKRENAVKRRLNGPYYVGDNPFPDIDELGDSEEFNDIFSSGDFDTLLQFLGVKQKVDLGSLLEVRCYGRKGFMDYNDIMEYEDYIDPATGVPVVCFLKLERILKPTYELMERG